MIVSLHRVIYELQTYPHISWLPKFLKIQWIRLENNAMNQQLWKVKGMWDQMNPEIISYANKKFT